MRVVSVGVVVLVSLLAAGAARAGGLSDPALMGYGDAGLTVGGTSLHGKPVSAAIYDRAQDLIWFVSKGTLQVIDLRAKKRKAVVIAKRFPDGPFGIEGVSNGSYAADYAGVYPVIVVGAKPKVGEGMGAYGGLWEDQDAAARKQIKRIKLVGKAWLKKQKKRAPRFEAAKPGDPLPKVTVPEEMMSCDDPDECGGAERFGETAYQLVTISYSCGDACHLSCALYDPKTKKFASPEASSPWGKAAEGGSCWGYGVDAGGKYFSGSNACQVDAKGTSCADTGWSLFGWYDPSGPAL
jgi:hypothetical protein